MIGHVRDVTVSSMLDLFEAATALPEPFARWFASRGWMPRAHQLELLSRAQAGRSALLIAPTGAGKTLAGFLPTLVELAAPRAPCAAPARAWREPVRAACTRFIFRRLRRLPSTSPAILKRRSRRWTSPVRVETRTGDTPASRRQRQRRYPPDILLTTPEQLALHSGFGRRAAPVRRPAPRRAR